MKNKYDLTIILVPSVKDEAKDKFVEKIEKVMKGLGGVVEKTMDMGRKQLAYKIVGKSEGVYVNLQIELPPESVIQLDKKLGVDKDILRHLLIRI